VGRDSAASNASPAGENLVRELMSLSFCQDRASLTRKRSTLFLAPPGNGRPFKAGPKHGEAGAVVAI
jgi:hypothetical protein